LTLAVMLMSSVLSKVLCGVSVPRPSFPPCDPPPIDICRDICLAMLYSLFDFPRSTLITFLLHTKMMNAHTPCKYTECFKNYQQVVFSPGTY